MRKKLFIAIMVLVYSVTCIVSVSAFENPEPVFQGQYATRITYIDDLGIYAITGYNGIITSEDGEHWNKRLNELADEPVAQLAYGNDIAIMIVNSSNNKHDYFYVSQNMLNTAIKVRGINSDGNSIIIRPEFVFDKASGYFLSGGIEYSGSTYTHAGLYRSKGEIEETEDGYTMLWEYVDMQGCDIYNYNYDWSFRADLNINLGEIYSIMKTDGNGHTIMTKKSVYSNFSSGVSPVEEGGEKKVDYTRMIMAIDSTGDEWSFNRANCGGTLPEIYIDKFENVFYGRTNVNMNTKIFRTKFSTIMNAAKDGIFSTSQVNNVNTKTSPSMSQIFASNGEYLISMPSYIWAEAKKDQVNDDIRLLTYNGSSTKSAYVNFINNEEILQRIFGTYEETNYVTDMACGNDGKFVAITGEYYHTSKKAFLNTSPTSIIVIDTNGLDINSEYDKNADIDRSDNIRFVSDITDNTSKIDLKLPEKITASIGESVSFDCDLYDYDNNIVRENVEYEVLELSEFSDGCLDFSAINQGLIKVSDDLSFGGICTFTLAAKNVENPSVKTKKNITLTVNSPIQVNSVIDKTSRFARGDKISVDFDVKNNTNSKFKGLAVLCMKKGNSYTDFNLTYVFLDENTVSESLSFSTTLDESDDYSSADVRFYLLDLSSKTIVNY